MASKAAEIQMNIKENSQELSDFLQDLNRWEDKIKKEDEHLKTTRRIEEKLPPVRSKKIKKSSDAKNDRNNNGKQESSTEKSKKQKIKSYDYGAWSKFDVETACKEVSDVEEQTSTSEEDDEEFEKMQAERRVQQANMEKEKGNELFKEGKYEASINRYTNAISLHSTNPILYANRGMALIKVEKFGAAEQDCSVALELDPTYAKAIARRATARLKLKKYALAKNDYELLLKHEPNNKQALLELKNINKILQSEPKTTVSEGNSKRTTQTETNRNDLSTIKQLKKEAPKRKRSNKPLKRVFIQEIGASDDENENEKNILLKKNDKDVTGTCSRVPPIEASAVSMDTDLKTELRVPATSFLFETDFKKYKGNEELLYEYLKMIPLDAYTKLFHQCIDSLMSPFLTTLAKYSARSQSPVHKQLLELSKVNRFTMATMFLSKKDKLALQDLFAYMSSREYQCFELTQDVLISLRQKYGMK